jgi:hypothetical protein
MPLFDKNKARAWYVLISFSRNRIARRLGLLIVHLLAACLEKDEARPRLRSFEGRRSLLRQRETADFPIFFFGHALTS